MGNNNINTLAYCHTATLPHCHSAILPPCHSAPQPHEDTTRVDASHFNDADAARFSCFCCHSRYCRTWCSLSLSLSCRLFLCYCSSFNGLHPFSHSPRHDLLPLRLPLPLTLPWQHSLLLSLAIWFQFRLCCCWLCSAVSSVVFPLFPHCCCCLSVFLSHLIRAKESEEG